MAVRKIKLSEIETPYNGVFSDYAMETVDMFVTLDRYLQKNYGPRCEDFEPDCIVCKLYANRDTMKNFICD